MSVRYATHLIEPPPATLHRDIVMATRTAPTKVCHQALLGCGQKDNQSRLFTIIRGAPSMCDYSLHHVATRPARIEDRLVTTKFHNTITRGFASVSDPRVAVCLMPGTELAFDRDVECVKGRLQVSAAAVER